MANDLAFSCEAARVRLQCSQDVARLRLLQRRVSQSRASARLMIVAERMA
jgi:hypothetical protein